MKLFMIFLKNKIYNKTRKIKFQMSFNLQEIERQNKPC